MFVPKLPKFTADPILKLSDIVSIIMPNNRLLSDQLKKSCRSRGNRSTVLEIAQAIPICISVASINAAATVRRARLCFVNILITIRHFPD